MLRFYLPFGQIKEKPGRDCALTDKKARSRCAQLAVVLKYLESSVKSLLTFLPNKGES